MNTSSERSGPQWPKWWLIILPLLLLPVLLAAGLLAQVASATMTDVVRASGANSVLEPNETPSPTPTVCGATWQVVSSPNIASYSNQLNDVAEISANDVWAVGYYYYGQTYKTLIEHWDGSVWSIVPSPNVPGYYNTLQSVSAISPNDIWAVGGHGPGSGSGHTLTEHWDGTQWSIVPSPNPDPYETILNSVVALSPNDVWAVGSTTPAFAWQTLIIHWDGTQWAVVTSPNPGPSDNSLNDITAISANDIWAVGDYYTGSDDRHHALTIHWNGIQWNTVASPDTGTEHFLRSITALATNDVWAVGYYGGNFATNTLTQHWDGTQWTIISSPNPGVQNVLYAVDALSSNDIWAVGDYFNGTIAVHWDGISWALVPSPNPGSSYNHLYGVAAGTIDEEWAVGDYLTGGVLGTLIERYNDPCTPPPTYTPTPTVCKLQWQLVSSPNIGSLGGDLNGVAAISANDIWAVGYYWNDGSSRTLIAHWDGSQWSIVLGPNAGPKYGSELNGVAAISANDIWAVGYYWNDGPYRTLIEHWDGSQWSIVPSPNSSTGDNVLYEVASVSATHLWAVGYYNNQNQGEIDTLVEHWDGTQWSIVPSPNFSDLGSGLTGVAAISANDVWAVGNYINTGLSRAQTLIEHWDGSQWSIVPSPNTGSPYANYLNGMAAISANDVWAAGYYGDAATLVEHWDGSQWSIVPSPNAGPAFKSYLNGMAAISANDVWAVGRADAAVQQTLVERYNNPCGAPTPTNTPTSTVTGTPPTTTSTLTRTNTPNAAPTLCPITFTDVHTTDYFYVPVQYLFCRGVIAGYGTEFRPYNNTSRGQLAKIVVLGFSLPINTTGGPHFVDVPTSNVFYPYVETAFNRGIVNGYGTEYRPNDNVTRGQLSKIVVLTAGWQLRTPTTATFTDVPLGGTFFSYVETAVCHGIVSGYGTLFKPNDPATRGQISKIVYLALTSTTVCP